MYYVNVDVGNRNVCIVGITIKVMLVSLVLNVGIVCIFVMVILVLCVLW